MKYRGIVFDKDGTLLDFKQTWLPVYQFASHEFAPDDSVLQQQLLEQHGFDADKQQFIGGSLLAAGNNGEIATAWAKQLGRTNEVNKIARRLNQIFCQQSAKKATAVNQLKPTLQHLKKMGLKLAVATADSHQGIIDSLKPFDVLDQFDFLAGYDSGYGAKPDAGMVLEFCRQMDIPADQVIVVGDNIHDLQMGRNAKSGLCVGVLTGTSTTADLEQLADLVLDDISQLPNYISNPPS